MEKNLMDFENPSQSETLIDIESDAPGSNPFDTLLETAQTCQHTGIGEGSFPFFEHIDIDCGRESLGILQIDFENIQFADTNWLNVPGIKLNEAQSTPEKSFDQLNTGFLYSEISNKNNKLSASTTISSTYSDNFESHLNTAFLYSNRNNKLSASSSISSRSYSHSDILDIHELSKIHPINKTYKCDSEITSIINEKSDCMLTKPRIQSFPTALQSTVKGVRKSENLLRKCFMTPQFTKEPYIENDNFGDSVFIEAKHIASSFGNESIYDTADGELYSLDCTPQPDWVDVCDVFDENVATATADIFKNVDKMIPFTFDLPTSTETIKHVEDKICGAPDEKLLDNSKKLNSSKATDNTSCSSSSSRNDCLTNLSDIFNGDNKRLSSSRLSHCSNNSQSKDAKSILTNLSEILSNENPSAQQKHEGQNLLFSLADILYSSDIKNSLNEREQSEDSGNSSIDQEILPINKEEDTSCDVLDLRINNETPIDQPLDLSVSNMKHQKSLKKLAIDPVARNEVAVMKSFNVTPPIDRSKNESANSSDGRNVSNLKTNISELSSLGKLKPKKIDKKIIPEKGPLKAMIPVGSMSKPKGTSRNQRIDDTPPKGNQYTSVYKTKRASTSQTGSKLRPIAQSTPEGNSANKKHIQTTSQLPQRRLDNPVSPLTRTKSVKSESTEELNKRNHSGSTPNLSSSCNSKNNSSTKLSQPIFRRRSESEIKLSKDVGKFRRSNTIDKATEISSTLSRVRTSIEKARHSSIGVRSTDSTKAVQSKLILGERNRLSSSPNIKPCNLVNKMKIGKENKLKK